jgi:hypothetical protein
MSQLYPGPYENQPKVIARRKRRELRSRRHSVVAALGSTRITPMTVLAVAEEHRIVGDGLPQCDEFRR